jgi:hypothetical protein
MREEKGEMMMIALAMVVAVAAMATGSCGSLTAMELNVYYYRNNCLFKVIHIIPSIPSLQSFPDRASKLGNTVTSTVSLLRYLISIHPFIYSTPHHSRLIIMLCT